MFRADNLSLTRELHTASKPVIAGAFDPPTDRALLVFDVDSAADVEAFVAATRTSRTASSRAAASGRGRW